jgi:eukaryotic-like serine/threonine-protein kinase
MAISDTLIDTVFDGRYRILRKLGAGGMANVYLAEDQELGRRVAIKILNDRHANDDQFVERFRREAKNAAGLSHPNIVSVYDRGEAEGTSYIAMEYLEGRTLKELLVTQGPTPIKVAINYTRQILAAIGFAHRHGIVHRDIKPHNVLVDHDGRLKVTDFGIARSGASQMTEAGSIIGTAQYLSPEQARGAPVDRTSDLYSVGIVLYEMLTGTVPFTGDTPVEIAMKHLSAVPDPPSARRPEVPPDLDKIVLRALAKAPLERYATAEEMEDDLARVAQGQSVSRMTDEAATMVLAGEAAAEPTLIQRRGPVVEAPPPPPPPAYYDYEEPQPRRRPFWPWLLALLLLVAAGVGIFYAYSKIQDELNANKPVAVPLVEGLRLDLAKAQIEKKELRAEIRREFDDEVRRGFVISQAPAAGNRIDKGNFVTLVVSRGKPTTKVPSVVGKASTDAVALLAEANLKARVFRINSDKPTDTVIAQDPHAGETVIENTPVRINVSQGPKPIGVPPVIGQPFENANSALQGAGFRVTRVDADSNQPKGTVIDQDPNANTLQPKGTTITLTVSRGSKTSIIPDVTSQDEDTAASTLETSGFRVRVSDQEVTDPTQDGIVLSQDPPGDTEAKAGSKVTIVVGRLTTVTTPTTP